MLPGGRRPRESQVLMISPASDLLREPRLEPHAFAAAPAWLWTADGKRILWANAAGAAAFESASRADLLASGAAVSPARSTELARIASALPANGNSQLARLRAFSSDYGHAALFSCALVQLGAQSAVLVVAAEPPRRHLPLTDRARGLLAGAGAIAAFDADGTVLYTDAALAAQFGDAMRLETFTADAGEFGNATPFGRAVLHHYPVERGTVIVAWLSPQAAAFHTQNAPTRAADLPARRQPLRFVWDTDREGNFTTPSEEFLTIVGARTRAALGKPWRVLADLLNIDPQATISAALASRQTWNSLVVDWPVDGSDERLPIALSGVPATDQTRSFAGYRGFGICRDMDRIAAILETRHAALPSEAPPPGAAADVFTSVVAQPETQPNEEEDATASEPRPAPFAIVPAAKNVVPFRSAAAIPAERRPVLTPIERNAFQEIARALGARFASDGSAERADLPRRRAEPDLDMESFALDTEAEDAELIPEDFVQEISRALEEGAAAARRARALEQGAEEAATERDGAEEIVSPDARENAAIAAATDATGRDPVPERVVLDRLPVAVLVYRGSQLLYANRTFQEWTGFSDLPALENAGGMERLFSAAPPHISDEAENGGRSLALRKANGEPCCVNARLFSIQWESDPALLYVFTKVDGRSAGQGGLNARELGSILDTATDGVVVLDEQGRLLSGNRSAQALFGCDAADFAAREFSDLFPQESRREAMAYFEALRRNRVDGLLNDGREMVGRVRRKGEADGLVPLFVTMGRISDDPIKFCAIFRDATEHRRAEEELRSARQRAQEVAGVRTELLAKVTHDIRTPLNAIIGFSEVMLEERIGPVSSDRHREYLGHIHSSGQQVLALLNDLLDLSQIQSGQFGLELGRVDLNAVTQEAVAQAQPQANRERVIIRSSFTPELPPVTADARTIRQIVLNLLTHCISLGAAGAQIIVSTSRDESGRAVLRVRGTNGGLNARDIAAALDPPRQTKPHTHETGGSSLALPLTKALAEANGATFSIRSAPSSGCLVEIAFPFAQAAVEK
jgi:PAS domain S-box-containing protein